MKNELLPICFPVFKVESVELSKNPNMLYNSGNAYAIVARWLDGKEKTLNYCSSVYKLIENSLILEPLIPVLESKFKHLDISVGNDWDAQFNVKISPVVPSFSLKSEVIKPAITFTNSYDGKVLAQALGGLVRYMVDEKGVVTKSFASYLQGLSFAYTFKHSNENIYSMLAISGLIDQYVADFKTIETQIETMKAVNVEKPTSNKLEKLIRKLASGTVFPLKEIEETINRIQYESEVFDTDPTLWSIYISMNYILETSESELTMKARMDADRNIYANVCEFFPDQKAKKKKK